MTVKQLIKQLEVLDPNSRVHFSYPSGDHWRTKIMPEVTAIMKERVKYSTYHNKPVQADDGEEVMVIIGG